jgi:hypothetical protein
VKVFWIRYILSELVSNCKQTIFYFRPAVDEYLNTYNMNKTIPEYSNIFLVFVSAVLEFLK